MVTFGLYRITYPLTILWLSADARYRKINAKRFRPRGIVCGTVVFYKSRRTVLLAAFLAYAADCYIRYLVPSEAI